MTQVRRPLAVALLIFGLAACQKAPVPDAPKAALATARPAHCLATQPVNLADPKEGMVWIPAGDTVIGSDKWREEEAPKRHEHVGGFWIDRHEVTTADYAAFVKATGYVTYAERDNNGGAVFHKPPQPVSLDDSTQWWRLDRKASWRAPEGEGSRTEGDDFPVVQLTYEDAAAYARWRGREMPTEAEWEYAARGGLKDADYTWGDEGHPNGKYLANHWQGAFPMDDTGADGFKGMAPVGCFPANGYGLYDMAGNVWEITQTLWPAGGSGAHVIKGGSFLCADNYCLRYRPSARQPGDDTLGSDHVGFRTVLHAPGPK